MFDAKKQLEKFNKNEEQRRAEFESALKIKSEIFEDLIPNIKSELQENDFKLNVISAFKGKPTIFITVKDRNVMGDIISHYLNDMLTTFYLKGYDAGFRTKEEIIKKFKDTKYTDKNGVEMNGLEYCEPKTIEVQGFWVTTKYWEFNGKKDLEVSFETSKYTYHIKIEDYNFYGQDDFTERLISKKAVQKAGIRKYVSTYSFMPKGSFSSFIISGGDLRTYCGIYDDYAKLVKMFTGKEGCDEC